MNSSYAAHAAGGIIEGGAIGALIFTLYVLVRSVLRRLRRLAWTPTTPAARPVRLFSDLDDPDLDDWLDAGADLDEGEASGDGGWLDSLEPVHPAWLDDMAPEHVHQDLLDDDDDRHNQ